MGIREEMEKLHGPIYFRQDADPQHRDMLFRDDVLSIFDKWECVTEEVVPEHDTNWTESHALAKKIAFVVYDSTPGDHIIIYRRKGK